MSIYRAYDIRGIYPGQLDEGLAEKIGAAFGTLLGGGKVAVGIDARKSGPALKDALVKGLRGAGIDVLDIGLVPTPLVYFATAYHKLDGGAMVTASVDGNEYTLVENVKTKERSLVKVGEFIEKSDFRDFAVLAFAPKTGKVSFKKIKGVFKHPLKDKLFELRLGGGRSVKVTECHSVFTYRNGKIVSIPTKGLRVGDLIAVPAHIPNYSYIPEINLAKELWAYRNELRGIMLSGPDVIEAVRTKNLSSKIKKIELRPEGRRLLLEKRKARKLSRKKASWLAGLSPMTIQRIELGTGRKYVKKSCIEKYLKFLEAPKGFLAKFSHSEKIFDQNLKGGRTFDCARLVDLGKADINRIGVCMLHGLGYPKNATNNVLEISPEFARLLGYYVAEGSLECRARVCFNLGCLSTGHEGIIARDIEAISEKIFGLKPKVYTKRGNATKVTLDNTVVFGLFAKILGFEGQTSRSKKFPSFVFTLPEQSRIEFLKGVFLGDGCVLPRGIKFSTTSRELSNGIGYLLTQLGIVYSLWKKKDRRENRAILYEIYISDKDSVKRVKNIWTNHWKANNLKLSSRRSGFARFNDLYLVPIKEMRTVSPSSTKVYDFSVDGETFIAGAGGVCCHNSHNPPNYNGFKFCVKKGVCLSYETGIARIEELVKAGKFREGSGSLEKKDLSDEYARFVLGKVKVAKPLKVVIDAGNGSAGPLTAKVFRAAGCEVVELYCEPDGEFPNHQPDPLKPETLEDLQAKVLETGADLGIAYDGDGDRIGVVDEQGRLLENSKVFALFIKELLGKQPGAKVIHDVVSSRMVDDVTRQSGVPVVSRVGHSYIQLRLLEEGCDLAGENSGHYFFRENFGFDDAVFAGLKLLGIAAGGRLSELVKAFPVYFGSKDYRVECPDERKFQVVEELKARLRKEHQVVDIDGVRVNFPKGWFIIRASNTGPQLAVRWEASEKEEFGRIKALVQAQLESVGLKLE